MKDFDKTVISQYSNSTVLTQLITNLNEYIDPSANLEQFYQLIWNIDTAQGYGLDVWGRIVGINRILTIAAGSYFGFGEAQDRTGFNQSVFEIYGEPTTTNYILEDQAFRFLIFAKAAANITDCSIPAINQILMNLFPGRGNAYVTDGANGTFGNFFGFTEAGDRQAFGNGPFIDLFQATIPEIMTLTYVFEFILAPFEISIVNAGVLPKPTGVRSSVQIGVVAPFTPAPLPPPVLVPTWPNPNTDFKYSPSRYIGYRGGRLYLA